MLRAGSRILASSAKSHRSRVRRVLERPAMIVEKSPCQSCLCGMCGDDAKMAARLCNIKMRCGKSCDTCAHGGFSESSDKPVRFFWGFQLPGWFQDVSKSGSPSWGHIPLSAPARVKWLPARGGTLIWNSSSSPFHAPCTAAAVHRFEMFRASCARFTSSENEGRGEPIRSGLRVRLLRA